MLEITASVLLEAVWHTILLAAFGTTMGFLLALSFARVFLVRSKGATIATAPVRFLIHALRATPELILVLVLMQVFGIGALAAGLAIALGTLGVSGILVPEALKAKELRLADTLALSGPKRFFAVLLPGAIVELGSQFLFRFDINLRIAVLFGVFGAGGLGLLLKSTLGSFNYLASAQILAVLILLLLTVEALSGFLKTRLTTSETSVYSNPLTWLIPVGALVLSGFFIAASFSFSGVAKRLEVTGAFLEQLLRPDFVTFGPELAGAFGYSILVAVLGLLLALIYAFSLGGLGSLAVNGSQTAVRLVGMLLAISRSVPTVVLGLVVLVAFGRSFWVVVSLLGFGVGNVLVKLVIDSLDSLSANEVKQIFAAGLGFPARLWLALFGFGKNRSLFIFFFGFDQSFRYSIVLGAIGAGGLGSLLIDAVRVYNLSVVSAIGVLAIATLGFWQLLQGASRKRTAA